MVKGRPSKEAREAQGMAERAGFGKTDVAGEFGVIKPDLGEGVQPVTVPEGQANFFDFEDRGQKIVGTLVGTTIIRPKKGKDAGKELERWVFLPDGEADTVTLPSYYDLDLRITKLVSTNQLPIRGVVMQYLGKVKARTIAGFVKRFAVGRLPAGEQQTLGGKDEVPF